MYIKLFFLILSLIFLTILAITIPIFKDIKIIFIVSMPILIGYALFPDWFFQGIEKMKNIAFLNAGIKIFFTICVFIFIKEKSDYWMYPLFQSAGYIGAAFIGQYLLHSRYKIILLPIKRKLLFQTLKKNFPIFLNQFTPSLFNNTTIFLMGILINTYTIGVFDAIKKIILLESIFINVISKVFFPFLNRNRHHFKKFAISTLIVLGLVILIILFSHQLFFKLFNIEYPLAFIILFLLSIGIFFIGIYSVFATNYLVVLRRDNIVMRITIISSLLGLLSAYPLIFFFGVMGGTINIMSCQILMGLLAYKKYREVLKKKN